MLHVTGMRQITFNGNRSCITGSNFASGLVFRGGHAVRFDQDVELVRTGKLIVEISLGRPVAAGRTICSNFTWSAALQQLYMIKIGSWRFSLVTSGAWT